ncbi:MAG TPA: hypothetical protein VFR81_30150 [Longimicrobium sp.]|nr:hypothetical protein [Longimicrobium sp.]
MSRASEVLEALRRAEAAAREEVARLLAPAGLAVSEIRPDGDGWRLRVVADVRSAAGGAGREGAQPVAAADDSAGARVPAPQTRGVEPLVRQPGETLMALVSRAGDRLRVSRGEGPGGVCVEPATDAERVEWLAGTLVGDTVLALRHLGEPEDGDRAIEELHRQLGLFLRESRRLVRSEDPGPFLEAVDRWMPARFPRGRAFLARGEGVAHA